MDAGDALMHTADHGWVLPSEGKPGSFCGTSSFCWEKWIQYESRSCNVLCASAPF